MIDTKNGSRWWEFNLVRYFLGTLVGSFIVYLVFNHFVDGLKGIKDYEFLYNKLCDLQSLSTNYNQWFYLGAGFIFCYISSSPILVIHACRFKLKDKINLSIIYLSIVWVISILILLSLINYIEILMFFVLIIFIVLQFYFLKKSWNQETISIYKKLTRNRENTSYTVIEGNHPNGRKTYVESYKHLREHGNAFFIVILEIILGLLLYQIKTPELMITCVIIWIFPGALIWFFGNYLESILYD